MPPRYLLGPVLSSEAHHWRAVRDPGRCFAFNASGGLDLTIGPSDSWDDICHRLPRGWRPDFLALHLGYTTFPASLWAAPVPLVGLAPDWNLLWHHYRRALRRCDLVLTDTPGVEALARAGFRHARAANLFGCDPELLDGPWPGGPRDIDVLFVGNLHPAVQRERLAWLGRLARLGERWTVVIATGVFGAEYRALLGRARVVFNRSLRGECNLRAMEAAAAGALLFQEADNREVPAYFRHLRECVCYRDEDLEARLEHYLSHEDERRALAEAAQRRVREYGVAALWGRALDAVAAEWHDLAARARIHPAPDEEDALLDRTWQAISCAEGRDDGLARALERALAGRPGAAGLHNALGVVRAVAGAPPAAVVEHFRRAVAADPGHLVAVLNLVEALVALDDRALATDGARRLLAALDREPGLAAGVLDAPHYPPGFDLFRVEWERAAWENAGRPAAEARAKGALLRWRLHALLADLTGDLVHYHEAALARPDLPATRAALGCALGRAGRPAEAVPHLRHAVENTPFDAAAAAALHLALTQAGDGEGAGLLAHERRLLARAAPGLVRPDPWFAVATLAAVDPAPTAVVSAAAAVPRRIRVSLCMIVKDEEENLPECLASAVGLVDEVVVVDTGSTDRTREVAARLGARVVDFRWVDSFAAARNESLRHATGDWAFWLDADDRLDEEDRHKLAALFAGLRDENAAYVMKCLCLPDPQSNNGTLVDHVRLFRNRPDVRWDYRVHEQILPAVRDAGGEVRWTDIVVRHAGYTDPALRRRKLERDLRLLRLEDTERPNAPFVLFNLGMVSRELGRLTEALDYFRRSLERSHPADSITRKLFAQIASCCWRLGRPQEALAACREGRGYYPDDAELLYLEGGLREEAGDLGGAEACWRRLVDGHDGPHFASVGAGLRGYLARHRLAQLCLRRGEQAEAATQWRAALAEHPDFAEAWQGLQELERRRGQPGDPADVTPGFSLTSDAWAVTFDPGRADASRTPAPSTGNAERGRRGPAA
jgi:tetratricopeptide (TPR) repeat protein